MDATHLYFLIVAPQITPLDVAQQTEQMCLMNIKSEFPLGCRYGLAPDDPSLPLLLLT
jgi:hypothetical protein